MGEKPRKPRIVLLETDVAEAPFLDCVSSIGASRGHVVTRLVVASDPLAAGDSAVEELLDRVRGQGGTDGHDGKPILVGIGLGANLALWMSALDRSVPVHKFYGRQTVIFPGQLERAPALGGVVAVGPFLGFDFSLSTGTRSGSEAWLQWRLDRCRGSGWVARLLGACRVPRPSEHGLAFDPPIQWRQLSRVLPFASVAKLLPSLKTPSVLMLPHGASLGRVSVLLCALNGRVVVMDSPIDGSALGHATLEAVDRLVEGAAGIDG